MFPAKRSLKRSIILSILQGCIRNFYIDNKLYGLPEVDVTNNITTGCFLKSRANKDCGLNCTDEGKNPRQICFTNFLLPMFVSPDGKLILPRLMFLRKIKIPRRERNINVVIRAGSNYNPT